jgi:hypothetical protein
MYLLLLCMSIRYTLSTLSTVQKRRLCLVRICDALTDFSPAFIPLRTIIITKMQSLPHKEHIPSHKDEAA